MTLSLIHVAAVNINNSLILMKQSVNSLYIDLQAVAVTCSKEQKMTLSMLIIKDFQGANNVSFEPPSDETNKMTVHPHPPSLIRVFAVHSMGS